MCLSNTSTVIKWPMLLLSLLNIIMCAKLMYLRFCLPVLCAARQTCSTLHIGKMMKSQRAQVYWFEGGSLSVEWCHVSLFLHETLLLFISKVINSITLSPVHCQISHHQGQVAELWITSSATNLRQYRLHQAPIRGGRGHWVDLDLLCLCNYTLLD